MYLSFIGENVKRLFCNYSFILRFVVTIFILVLFSFACVELNAVVTYGVVAFYAYIDKLILKYGGPLRSKKFDIPSLSVNHKFVLIFLYELLGLKIIPFATTLLVLLFSGVTTLSFYVNFVIIYLSYNAMILFMKYLSSHHRVIYWCMIGYLYLNMYFCAHLIFTSKDQIWNDLIVTHYQSLSFVALTVMTVCLSTTYLSLRKRVTSQS